MLISLSVLGNIMAALLPAIQAQVDSTIYSDSLAGLTRLSESSAKLTPIPFLTTTQPRSDSSSIAQTAQVPADRNPSQVNPPTQIPQPPLPTQPLPPPSELLPTPPEPPEAEPTPAETLSEIEVREFRVERRDDDVEERDEQPLIFDANVLAEVARRAAIDENFPPQQAEHPEDCPEFEATDARIEPPLLLSFADILRASSAITDYYTCRGYVTSGAIIPTQTSRDGIVRILVVEGSLEADGIVIEGTRRLHRAYIRDRLARFARPPLNVNRLLEGLRLLQLDPLIQSISADLQTGTRPGTNRLVVQVQEADTFSVIPGIDNNRSPSVGSFRRQLQVSQANLLGFGDGLSVNYANTDGSNQVDASYLIPLNSRNGTLRLAFGLSNSHVIEPPFDVLDIESTSRYYEVSLRQPLFQSPTEEFAIGLTASRQESQAEYSPGDSEPLAFPALGADEEGRTQISTLRFFQDWTQRGNTYVLAARSQFSLGLDLLDATVNESVPDSRFLAWRGQVQWVRLLAPETLLLVRGDVQLADSPLLSQEQFSLGGRDTLRGYRQDFLLTDNGALLSAEARLPIFPVGRDGVVQVVPFVDVGAGWNSEGENPDPSTLASVGLGLLWRQGDNFAVRLDWGIPLVSDDSRNRTWQESGFYFSLFYTPF